MLVTETRYQNYLKLLAEFKEEVRRKDPGAPTKGMLQLFADHCDIPRVYGSHIDSKYKNIGPQSARKMERAFGRHTGWMDEPHASASSKSDAAAEPVIVGEPEPVPVNPLSIAAANKSELEFLKKAQELFRADAGEAWALLLERMTVK